MHPHYSKALDALRKAEYPLVFDLLQQANALNHDLNLLKKEFEIEGIKTTFAQRLEIAIKDAFTTSPSHYPTASQVHFLLPFSPPTSHFIGRQGELDSLHAHLRAGKRTILVNGLGGVGKTTLAQKYVQDYQTEYAHILWLRQSGSIVTSFINRALFRSLGLPLETGEDMYAPFYDALRALKTLQGNNLLIIDNYELTDTDLTNDSLGKLCTLPTAWRVLCTSRNDVDFFDETMRLDVLPAHEAIQVFQAHTGGKPADSAEVGELLKMIGYHTLMTELLAKTYKQCLQFGTVGELHAYLKERNLQDQQLSKKIYVDRQATTLYAHLSAVFSLASLTEVETWVLKQWVVLPTAPHQAKDFLTWIDDTDLAYENTLLDLVEKGWLQTDNRLAYSLHPFLQLFLHQTLKPTLPDCYKMWDYFTDLMDMKKVQAHPLAYQWTIAIGEAMVQYIDFTNHEQKQGTLWYGIANIYRLLGDYPNAIKCAKEVVAIQKATVGETHEEYATSLNNLAYLYDSQSNYAEALSLYQEALQIRKEVLGKQHPHYAQSLNNLASLYDNQGNYAKALPLHQEALQIWKEVLGKRHPDYATSLNNLASLYHHQGNYAEALPLHQESLQIRKEVLGERHPDTAQSLNNLAGLYRNQGNYAEALPLYQEALQIWKEVLGKRHPSYAIALSNLALLYYHQGNYAEALPLYQEALQIHKEVLGERHPDTAIDLYNIGILYFMQKNYKQANKYLIEAYDIYLEKLPEQHPLTQAVKSWLDALPFLP